MAVAAANDQEDEKKLANVDDGWAGRLRGAWKKFLCRTTHSS